MTKADEVYLELLRDIKNNGVRKGDRTGTGTISVFGREVRFNMADGFPLLTTKKVFTKAMIHELLWFLNGDTNIKYLVDNGVGIWTGDAYKHYLKSLKDEVGNWCHPECDVYTKDEFTEKIKTDSHFAKQWGELGPVYGKQWVNWGGHEINSGKEIEGLNKGVNQIQNVIDTLKTNPNSRRIMVNAWNPSDIGKMVLPPCHYGFELNTVELSIGERMKIHNPDDSPMGAMVYTHKFFDSYNIPKHKLSLKWIQRSVDTFLGLPFNIASYGLLLHMIAQQVNMVPNELIGSLGDTHLYLNHLEQVDLQLSREPRELPTIKLEKADDIFSYCYENVKFEGYDPHPAIKAELSN